MKDQDIKVRLIEDNSRDVCLVQEMLAEAEKLAKDLLDSSRVNIFIIQDGKFQLVNPQLQKFTGYSESELLGMDSLELVLPEDRKIVREKTIEMLQGKRSAPYEYRIVSKDRKVRWVMETVSSIQYRGKRATLGNSMDTTEYKRAEKALAMQKELTDRILASTPNAVLVIDRHSAIILANNTFCKTFKEKREDIEGRQISQVLPVTELAEAISQTLTDGKPQPKLEFSYPIKNEPKIMVAQITPMEEDILLILQDITEDKVWKEQINHIERLATIGELASSIAHELNNPLTSVMGYAELILSAALPSPIKKDIEIIYSNAQRAVTIVRDLLTFTRRQPLEKQLGNINDLIQHVLEMHHYELKISNIEVRTELTPDLPLIMVDPRQLEQVFLNIIQNAEAAMLESYRRGCLTIKTEVTKNRVRISFADNGPGISQKNLPRIFDPFFTTKEPGKGTGLGLSICYGIVTKHGGSIYAESKIDEVTTFFVELPR